MITLYKLHTMHPYFGLQDWKLINILRKTPVRMCIVPHISKKMFYIRHVQLKHSISRDRWFYDEILALWWAGSSSPRAGAESGCCCRQNPVQTESWPLAGGGGRGDHLPSEPPLVPPCQFGRRQTNGAVCLPVSTRSKAHVDRWTKCFWPDDKIFGIFYDWESGTLWHPICLLLR